MLNLSQQFRPKRIQDFIGQEHLLNESSPLNLMIQDDNNLLNLIIFGPPGSGKTSFAKLVATIKNKPFLNFNATNFKLDSLKKELQDFQNTLIKPLLFIDEVHRLNIAQQEFLLPLIEDSRIFFIGASTQNPFFSLSAALRSRLFLFEFKSLESKDLEKLYERVMKSYPPKHEFLHVKTWLLDNHCGDVRAFLNILEVALLLDSKGEVNLESLKQITKNSLGVREQNVHYDYISALIKSIRGSDENAAIYYLACLIQSGENPEFIARRLVILASEDIGNANPNALNLSVSTMNAVRKIGYPEARIILSQCVIYLACSPKSNSAYNAINLALEDVKINMHDIPKHLQTHSKDYKYPHDFGGFVRQVYHHGKQYVFSKKIGFEKTLNEWLEKIRGE